MRKVTRKSLDELAKVMPVISEESQKMYVGGTSGYTGGDPPSGPTGSSDGGWTPPPPVPGPLGSPSNPYSIDEALGLMNGGHWGGGYVSGWGYVSAEVEVNSPTGSIPPTGYVGGYDGGYDGSSGGGYVGGYDGGSGGSYVGGYDGGYVGGYDGGSNGGAGGGSGGSSGSGTGGGSGSGNNSSYMPPGITGNCLDNNGSLYDGVNIQNTKNFTFNTESQSVFNEQLISILRSNSVLKSLLSYFDKGVVHMTFDIRGDVSIAQTTYPSYESYHITFSSQHINENGWNKILLGDNIDYDWSKVRTTEEALVVVLTHEAQHANHVARFREAAQQANNEPIKTAKLLKEWGYSQEYVDIFIENNNGKYSYVSGNQQVDNMHNYMNKYNHGVIDAALEEYRKDYNK